jgi:Kef-type K+ transport system membrane component KefB/nucleotide-binding universal stress UspA family protein
VGAFVPATDTSFLQFLLAFLVLLLVARVLGTLAGRFGQPAVIGELLAGILLSPSLLGLVAPGLAAGLFPGTGAQTVMLQTIAQLGVIFLLLFSGMETDLKMVRERLRQATIVAAAGMIIPFAAGAVLADFLPVSLIGTFSTRLVFILFVAVALSMSAIPVIVKILIDLDLLRRTTGQLILAAGMITDTTGWFLLALVAAMASRTASLMPLAGSILGMVALAVAAVTVAGPGLRRVLAWVDFHTEGSEGVLTAVVVLALAGGAITEALHVEAFLGAFLVGVALADIPRATRKAQPALEAVTLGVFAPVFFASAGLNVRLLQILSRPLLGITLLVIVIAFVGKFAGAWLGGQMAGLSPWLSVSLGAGLNARGAVEIITATIGLQLGILTPAMYSIVVAMAIATALAAPPVLRLALRRVPTQPEEEERLRRETVQQQSFLHRINRILVPVRDGRGAVTAVKLLRHLAAGREIDVVALHVAPGEAVGSLGWRPAVAEAPPFALDLPELPGIVWHVRVVKDAGGVVATVLAEADGYDLLVVGAAQPPVDGAIFGPIADGLVAGAPCPALVLHQPHHPPPGEPRQIIVPIAGTPDDTVAAEFAIAVAQGTGAEVVTVHVVMPPPPRGILGRTFPSATGPRTPGQRWTEQVSMARHAAGIVRSLGNLAGVAVRAVLPSGCPSVERAILAQVRSPSQDLILLATQRRLADSGLLLGPVVEYVVEHAVCPVLVLFPLAAHVVERMNLAVE